MPTALCMFFAMLIGHAVADYPLQGDFLAKGKNHLLPPIIPGERFSWVICMTAHCLIHAGAVWIITGKVWFGVIELVMHFWIDCAKCEGRTSFQTDQLLHVALKAIFASTFI